MSVLHPKPPITVRRSRYQAPAIASRTYVGQSPLLSHLLTALSVTFPAGEQFFVHSVRQVRNQVTDAQLQAQISGFIGQEAHHAEAHKGFNRTLHHTSYPIARYQQQAALGLAQLKQRTPRRQLAATVAYEHFTAILAAQMLTRPRIFANLDPNLKQLWLWHAVEELEHKSVAFDVYQHVFGNLAQRRRSMRTVTVAFGMGLAAMTSNLMWLDRKNSLYSISAMLHNTRDLIELIQLMIEVTPAYFSFYRANFHPNHIDHTELLQDWYKQLQLSTHAEKEHAVVVNE